MFLVVHRIAQILDHFIDQIFKFDTRGKTQNHRKKHSQKTARNHSKKSEQNEQFASKGKDKFFTQNIHFPTTPI
jgi:hypothetical protein